MGQIFDPSHFTTVPRLPEPADMAERVMTFAPASDAEVLKLLRETFPNRPLSARVAALAFLMRRQSLHARR